MESCLVSHNCQVLLGECEWRADVRFWRSIKNLIEFPATEWQVRLGSFFVASVLHNVTLRNRSSVSLWRSSRILKGGVP